MNDPNSRHVYIMYGNHNKYSWSSLIGAMEAKDTFKNYLLDLTVWRGTANEIIDRIKETPDDQYFVMLSGSSYYAKTMIKDLQELSKCKKHDGFGSKLITVAGGSHATARPSDFINAGADFVFVQECEESITTFFEEFYSREADHAKHKPFHPRKTPNCFFMREGQGPEFTVNGAMIDLNRYPPFAETSRLFRPIEISRGCPHGCKYCQTSNLFGREMRHRSVENIVKWTKRAVELKYDKLWVTTPNAFAYGSKGGLPEPAKIHALLKGLHEIEGLEKVFFGSFPSEVRPEFVTGEIMDIISPYVANKNFVVGVQSPSPRILELTNRGHTIDDVWRAIDIITSRGFMIDLDMIFGLPGEQEKDVQLTVDFIKEVMQNPLTRIHGHAFMPLPGTPYEFEEPGEIAKEIMKIIGHYAKIHRVYGAHFHQVYRAKKLRRTME
nr:TIGR04013 family B12-binding domain/radical SAM domain-containing protein [Candidatus Sigynarchaeota archaeon]